MESCIYSGMARACEREKDGALRNTTSWSIRGGGHTCDIEEKPRDD